MPTTPDDIDALDGLTPPSQSDPDNFRARGDAFLGAFPTLQSQINTTADQTYDNAVEAAAAAVSATSDAADADDYASMASAAANFVGQWADQTGAASVPYSVEHDGYLWMLLDDIADVTASEPATSNGDWYQLTIDNSSVTTFTSSGTYTKGGESLVIVEIWGAGGGGGSGEVNNAATVYGGTGGGGGAYNRKILLASELSATETVTIGAGGAGGAAQTSDASNGNDGVDGGNSSFGTLVYAGGGEGGKGGQGGTRSAIGGTPFPNSFDALFVSGFGARAGDSTSYRAGSFTGGSVQAEVADGFGSLYGGGAGGSGNRISSSGSVTADGTDGGSRNSYQGGGGTGSAAESETAGADGVNPGDGGGGGGTGDGSGTIDGADGGNGAQTGGGGGGGAAWDGADSGAGGDGGDGYCRVIAIA